MATRVRESAIFRKILVPLDGSPLAEFVIDYVERMADPARTTVTLLQVVAPIKPGTLLRLDESAALRTIADQRAKAEQYLERIRARLARRRIAARTVVRAGDPAAIIVDRARAEGVDLIALTTHGRTGLRRLLMGSVAEAVLRKSSVPVVLARGRGR
jgi:nucleotide-binding universal stress UspA family protein